MRFLRAFLMWLILISGLFMTHTVSAQTVGFCNIYNHDTYYFVPVPGAPVRMVQASNPSNVSIPLRDPSGQTFLQVPSLNFGSSYFISWSAQVLQVNQMGVQVVGACQFAPGWFPPPPPPVWYQPPMAPNFGFNLPNGQFASIPQAFADPTSPYGRPLFVTTREAEACQGRPDFEQCLLQAMLGDKEYAAFRCAEEASDGIGAVFCMVGELGGTNERQIAGRLQDCYSQFGKQWSQYSICLANDQFSNDQVRLLNCVAQQYEQTGNVNPLSTAFCYGANTFNLNTEMQIILSCAIATGGEATSFVGCAGGQLSVIEWQRCQTHGVGGDDGCFGRNNSIIRAMGSTGDALAQMLGENHAAVIAWRTAVEDILSGRATARVGAETLRVAMNQGQQAMNNVAREVSNAGNNVVGGVNTAVNNVRREAEGFVQNLCGNFC